MPVVFKPPTRIGFGNILIKLCEYIKKYGPDALVHASIKDYERGNAFKFNLNITDQEPDEDIQLDIFCNESTFREIGEILPKIMIPSQTLLNFNHKFATGIHIRCGAGAFDSRGLAAPRDSFVYQETFDTVDTIIPTLPTPIFLASDSEYVKTTLKQKWGDLISVFNSKITLSCDPSTCGGVEQTAQSLVDAYIEWYILSQCDGVITTMGPGFSDETQQGAGLSTYGFTAAAYGKKHLNVIHCEGLYVHIS